MYSFKEHYKKTLAPFYTRVYGGTEKNYALARSIFEGFGITEAETGSARKAADLGSGSGFFSVPLAHLGYQVLALDLDPYLCEEHRKLCKDSNVQVICDDLLNLPGHSSEKMDIILSMTDTLAHLESEAQILALFRMVADSLKPDGSLLISFRDQSVALEGDNRFIPFYSDNELIATTFVEFSESHLNVTDILYILEEESWRMQISSYRKLRLTRDRMKKLLDEANLHMTEQKTIRGMDYLLARRRALQGA